MGSWGFVIAKISKADVLVLESVIPVEGTIKIKMCKAYCHNNVSYFLCRI